MHALFLVLDKGGNGFLTREQFQEVGKDPRIMHLLSAMELEIRDADLVYDLTDDGDHHLSAKEMVYGFSRLKGNARSIDIMALIAMVRKAMAKIDYLDQKAHATRVSGFAEIKQ